MNREHKRSALACVIAQQLEDVANLPKVESVERLVHEQDRLWREQSQCQQQPATVTLGQRMHSLVKNRRQTNGVDHTGDLAGRSSIDTCKEGQDPRDRLILIRPDAIWQVEHGFSSARCRQWPSKPLKIARLRRKYASQNVEEGCLSGTIRTDDAEDLSPPNVEGHILALWLTR